MAKTAEVGRNDPCPCGSGPKYKKCCLTRAAEITQAARQVEERRKEHSKAYGEVKPVIHADFQGHTFVVVGDQLHYSRNWRTFTDFLFQYPKTVTGSEWWEAGLRKPYEARHPLVQWLNDMVKYRKSGRRVKDGLISSVPSGPMAAYLNLSYGLYTLRHNSELQDELVRRLKHPDQFQGAKYEVCVASSCVQAGFEINFEDESDKTKRHPEFIATHKATGQKISVEAKSKHRHGVLGYKGKGSSNQRAGVRRLLNDALDKPTTHPYVIFIDLNLPPCTEEDLKGHFREVASTTAKAEGDPKSDLSPFNLIFFTNHPHHYGDKDAPDPVKAWVGRTAENPRIVPKHPGAINALYRALDGYGRIPSEFPADSP